MNNKYINDSTITAILVDGGFYRRRAYSVLGDVSPQERADELESYCKRHLTERIYGTKKSHSLYRFFYYDCPPVEKIVYNLLLKKQVDLKNSPTYQWATQFFDCLKKKRKFALRYGTLSEAQAILTLLKKHLKNFVMANNF